jgi:hypothetical protein
MLSWGCGCNLLSRPNTPRWRETAPFLLVALLFPWRCEILPPLVAVSSLSSLIRVFNCTQRWKVRVIRCLFARNLLREWHNQTWDTFPEDSGHMSERGEDVIVSNICLSSLRFIACFSLSLRTDRHTKIKYDCCRWGSPIDEWSDVKQNTVITLFWIPASRWNGLTHLSSSPQTRRVVEPNVALTL